MTRMQLPGLRRRVNDGTRRPAEWTPELLEKVREVLNEPKTTPG